MKKVMMFMLALSVALLTACGSTKVYNTGKTLVYNGTIYNLTNVSVISTLVESQLSSGEVTNLKGIDKRGFESLLKEHSSLFVRTIVVLDEQQMIYQARQIGSYSDFRKMTKKFEKASNDIRKFMANKKSRQLQLK